MAIFIPHHVLLQHILPWLPVKSVARFMCVSTELRSFLLSKTFRRMHNRHIDYHQNPYKFLVFSGLDSTMGIINCEAPDNVLTPRSFRPLPIRTKGITIIRFLTSFHGLVCLLYEYFEDYNVYSYDLILWNPLTSEYKILSKPKSEISALGRFSAIGMFYSSCGDDYKLVNVISHNDVQIYSLKSDSWKTIAFQDTSDLKISKLSNVTCLNENLYFLDYNGKYYSVIRFDTKTETLTEIKGTPTLSHSQIGKSRLTLMVRKGCIHVFIMYDVNSTSSHNTKLIELWKINEEGNWKKMETYRGDYGYLHDHIMMNPLHLTSNGMLMYSTSPCRNYDGSISPCLYNVNLKRNSVKKNKPSKWIGKSKEPWPISNMYFSEIVRYNETFVSPNQYIK